MDYIALNIDFRSIDFCDGKLKICKLWLIASHMVPSLLICQQNLSKHLVSESPRHVYLNGILSHTVPNRVQVLNHEE